MTESIEQRFQRFRELDHDWDSYHALPLDPGIIDFTEKLYRVLTKRPFVVPHPYGGVSFDWRVEGLEIELEFLPNKEGEEGYRGSLYITTTDGTTIAYFVDEHTEDA